MKTGIEKFTDIMDKKTCSELINFLENNIELAADRNHGQNYENVECKQIVLTSGSDLDLEVKKSMYKITDGYAKNYKCNYWIK